MSSHREYFWLTSLIALTVSWESVGAALTNPPSSEAAAALRGEKLASEIGCAQCHADLPQNTTLRMAAPELSSAGLRYQPAWVLEYLQNPSRVRQHLGRARMPAYALSKKESLALTAFLETQREIAGQWPPIPADVAALATAPPTAVSEEQFKAQLTQGLICLTCHDYADQGGHRAVELTNVSLRLRPAWVARYLVAPVMFGVPPTTMPAQFFDVSPNRSSFRELIPEAARKIQVLTGHLFSLNSGRREALERKLVAAQREFPDVTAAQGETLFRSLNCAACHRHNAIPPRKDAAPALAAEGLRVQKNWLDAFLTHPVAVRPFGTHPGDGSRMPDFRLGADEVSDLSAFLRRQREGPEALKQDYHPASRSAFGLRKASLLLSEKLSCLGCHRFGVQGGRIGPDLTNARHRLQPSYVLGIIRDPRRVAPNSIMPKPLIPEDTARLVADFILEYDEPVTEATYLSPLEHPLVPFDDPAGVKTNGSSAAENYPRFCAPCHGATGQGDGFNAMFLAAKPTHHADRALMSAYPDDTLFDGIQAGGYILNKSRLMPAWGQTFTTTETRGLVQYIRGLCKCEGPQWSRDDEGIVKSLNR